MHRFAIRGALFALASFLVLPCAAAPKKAPATNPDLTKGEPLPEGKLHDWNLGATGARGWMFTEKLETTSARQILITKVDKGSPADGVLETGDVILGVARNRFSHDPRVEFGKALTAAEAGDGRLALTRWRKGTTANVEVKLPVLGAYSATAPYDCKKSKLIYENGCKSLAKRMEDPGYAKTQNPITRSLNAMALLASGKEEYLPLVQREAEWASGFESDSFETWWNAYVIMLLSEYQSATRDDSFAEGMKRLVMEAANGQSAVGSWGHKYALPNGTLSGYGMMNAPGVPLTISMIMARDNGLKDPVLDRAIERSTKLLRFYIGKGAVPYGDHGPWTQTHEDNGKCGMAGVMFNFLGDAKGAEYFSRMSVAAHGPERDTGHTGNFTNMTWAMPGVALSGPQATGAWMKEFGAWYYDLARTWDGRFPHPGAPELHGDAYDGWDSTGAYLMAYAMPLKKIRLTGKQPNLAPQIDAATAQSLILDGRGWSNADRTSAYDKLNEKELLERLGSWSVPVRERAAMALVRRKGNKPVRELVAMLDDPNLQARYGACEALGYLKAAAEPAVPKLTALLDHKDLWLRVKAAETLANIGPAAMKTLPQLLEKIAQGPTEEDPRGMEQRFMTFAVFDQMLKNSLDGVDRDQLRKAVAAVLHNEDGRARGSVPGIYQKLSPEDLKPILPAVLDAVVTPAPSGEMFADGVRVGGLKVLAKYHIEEGMKACVDYIRDQNKWASEKRTPELLAILQTYGAHAQAFIPELEKIAVSWDGGEKDYPGHLSKQKAQMLRDAVQAIKAATDRPELTRIR
jgi:hypothetical protein